MPLRRKIDRGRSSKKSTTAVAASAAAVEPPEPKQPPKDAQGKAAEHESSSEDEIVGSAQRPTGRASALAGGDEALVDSDSEKEELVVDEEDDASASEHEEKSSQEDSSELAEDSKPRSRRNRHSSKKPSDDEFIDESESEEEFDEQDSDEEFDSDEDLDESYGGGRKRSKKSAAVSRKSQRRSTRQAPSARRSKEFARQSKGSTASRARPKRGRRSQRSKEDESDSEAEHREDSSGGSDDPDGEAGGTGRLRASPSRAAAREASRKFAKLDGSESDEDQDEPVRKPRSRSKKKSDDDDAYESEEAPESGDDLDVENGLDGEESDSLELSRNSNGRGRRSASKAVASVANVGDDFGTADDSSDDEEQWQSPQLKTNPLRRSRPKIQDDGSASEESESSAAPKMPDCPSKIDVITDEDLPSRHVCYFSPDGSHRQCFALETLRKIAMTTPHPKFREDLTGGHQTFLQPPHFRSEMSADLLDQIASRFGRDALDLRGSFYYPNKKAKQQSDQSGSDDGAGGDYVVGYSAALADSSSFLERVGNYVNEFMGSQDVYACPLCYSVAHRRIQVPPSKRYDDDDEDAVEVEVDKCETADFRYDPMQILDSLDNGHFKVAAYFCFKQVAKLKKHLRNAHGVDTKVVKGNDMYARFKVRAPDGLLQRNMGSTKHSRHGDLLSYWRGGYSYDFVYLLHLIDHMVLCHEVVQSNDQDEGDETNEVVAAQKYLDPGEDFVSTFPRLALKLWDKIVAPYSSADNLGDWIANGEEEEEEDDPLAAHRELDAQAAREGMDSEQRLLEHLKRRARDDEGGEDSEEAEENEDGEAEESEEGVLEDVKNGGYFEEESSSEEDEWEAKILNKKRESLGSRESPSPRKGSGKALGSSSALRKRKGKPKTEDSSDDDVFVVAGGGSASRKRVIDDSDDE